jgi:hypothetical protein
METAAKESTAILRRHEIKKETFVRLSLSIVKLSRRGKQKD